MADQKTIKSGILLIVGFMLTALLGAQLLPSAFDAWFNTSTGSWGGITAALWPLVPVFVLIGVVLYFVGQAFDLI